MAEQIGRIVLAQKFFEDTKRIEEMAERASIQSSYFSGGKVPFSLLIKKYQFKDGALPDGDKPIQLENGVILDREIKLARRRFMAGYSEQLGLLIYIEVVGVED